MTDRSDSVDVIDAPDAAAIPRSRPGRAVARFGPGELVSFQSALATGRSREKGAVTIRWPASRGGAAAAPEPGADGPTDLQRLVAAVGCAHAARGAKTPRSPWPPELPADLAADDLAGAPADWCLVDEPDAQQQRPGGWRLGRGHLVVVGGPGCGATTTLATAALAAMRADPTVHVHGIDLDGGHLEALELHPAVGTIAGPSDPVRRSRLLRWLDQEVTRRRANPEPGPHLVVLIDDLGGLARVHDPIRESVIHERLARVWADGPAAGISVVASVRRAADLPPALAATASEILLHRSDDPSDGLRFSMKTPTEHFGPGRAVQRSTGHTVQVARFASTIASAVKAWGPDTAPPERPHEVGELAVDIAWSAAPGRVSFDGSVAAITVAVRDRDLMAAGVILHPGEHALVLGPPRSGKTNVLAAIARAAPKHVIIVGEGPLTELTGLTPMSGPAVADAVRELHRAIVLVDDCIEIADPDGSLDRLVAAPPSGVHIVASARPDRYRAAYGHWCADLKSSRIGWLLRPDPLDGDLLGQSLAARLDLAPTAGRGILVCGGVGEVMQVVRATGQPSAG